MNRTDQSQSRVGWIGIVLMGLLVSGCLAMDLRTEGELPGIRWHTQNYRYYRLVVEEREVYDYTLVLDETEGRDLIFTHLQARIRNTPHSREVEWKKVGRWHLPARGTLAIDLGSWRYCLAVNCRDWGPFAPVWHLVLTGKDAQGQPVRQVIRMRLPYAGETASSRTVRLCMPRPSPLNACLDSAGGPLSVRRFGGMRECYGSNSVAGAIAG